MRYYFFLTFLLFTCLVAEETTIDDEHVVLRVEDPRYADGVLTCTSGVFVEYPGLSIQAQNMTYIYQPDADHPVHQLIASGNLLVEYNDHFYVGDTITYDFIEKTGTVTRGVTCIERVYIGGKIFVLHPDHTISVDKLYLTTSADHDYVWNLRAESGTLDNKLVLRTEKVTCRIRDFPIFYFPSYTTQFRKPENSSPFRYKVNWESGQGPMIYGRALLYDNSNLAIYAKLEYRIKRGFGTAFETTYASDDKKASLKTRNFYAYDTFYNDNNPNQFASRARFQGIGSASSTDDSLETFVQWDRLTDRNMQTDFPSTDFELNTLMRTEAWIRKRDDLYNASLFFRPRLNGFQGFMQELPTFSLRFRPLLLGPTGVIMNNRFIGSFLDYVYSNNIDDILPNFQSGRIQLQSDIYRPFYFPFFTLTPRAGIDGIFYSQMTNQDPGFQVVGEYGIKATSSWEKTFSRYQHLFSPYAEFTALTNPTIAVGTPPIFSITDGLNQLTQMKFGIDNSLYSRDVMTTNPYVGIDIYGIALLNTSLFTKPIPKGYMHAQMHLPRISFDANLGWNFQENLFDFANFTTKWTINRYYAFNLEIRHQGRYYWKKDDPNNYILDVTRPIPELLDSTLSDNRNTLLARAQIQLAPQWWCQLESHTGWGRSLQPAYNEFKIDCYTIIATMWQLKLSFMHTVRVNEFTFAISMIPRQ